MVASTSVRGSSVEAEKRGRRPDGGKGDGAGHDQQRRRYPCRDASRRLQQAPGPQPEQVQAHASPQRHQDERHGVEPAVGEPRRRRAEQHQEIGGRKQEERGEVEQVVDPQAPAADEPVHRAEGAPGPGIQPALLRMPARQLDDGGGQRQEEQQPRQDPQRHRRLAGARAARDPPQAHDRDDVHRDDVPETEDPLKLRHSHPTTTTTRRHDGYGLGSGPGLRTSDSGLRTADPGPGTPDRHGVVVPVFFRASSTICRTSAISVGP